MLETKITTIHATFNHVKPGNPPSVSLNKVLTRPDGKQKYVSMSIPVRDRLMVARAEKELRPGDDVEVTIETRWAEEGIPKTLLSFAKVPVPLDKTLVTV